MVQLTTHMIVVAFITRHRKDQVGQMSTIVTSTQYSVSRGHMVPAECMCVCPFMHVCVSMYVCVYVHQVVEEKPYYYNNKTNELIITSHFLNRVACCLNIFSARLL